MSFKDKVVLVTGSSAGIGAATVIEFAKEGALVVVVGRDEGKLKDVAEKCQKNGPSPLLIKADVSIDDDVKRIVNETVQTFERIDVLVNNAGTIKDADITSDNFMEVYDYINNVNLRGVVLLTHLAIPYLIKSKGNIVNISSVAGISNLSMKNKISYCVSKAGLNHFTSSTAMNLADYGIRVNAISPGPVRTDIITRQKMDYLTWDEIGQMTALKRVSECQEVTDLIIFLASNRARGITGSNYLIDNGSMLLR